MKTYRLFFAAQGAAAVCSEAIAAANARQARNIACNRHGNRIEFLRAPASPTKKTAGAPSMPNM